MTEPVKLAVLGAGLIGKRHIEHVAAEPMAELWAVVDPSPVGEAIAGEHRTRWFPSFAVMMGAHRPDGVIIATPNQLHVANGLEAVAAARSSAIGFSTSAGRPAAMASSPFAT